MRLYKIGEQSYWIDEGYTLNAVLATVEKGYPRLDSDSFYGFYYLLNNYIITGAVKLGGFNPVAARMPAVFFGLGAVALIYLLGRQYFNALTGLSAAALTAFSYWEIAWSRQVRTYIQLQFFFLLSLYLFNSLINKFSYKKLICLILSTTAAVFSHYFGYFLLLIYALVLLINFLSAKKELKKKLWQNKKQALTIMASSFIILIFLIKLAFDFFFQLQSRDFFFGPNYQSFLITNLGLIVITALLGAIIAIIKKPNLKKTLGLITAYLIPYLIIVFTANSQHFRYLFFILPLLFIFSAYFICSMARGKYKYLISLILLVILIFGSNYLDPGAFVFTPRSHYYLEPHTPQPDFNGAYQAIIERGWGDDKIIISAFTQLDKIYLGRSDYWLAIDLHGRRLDRDQLNEREVYTNAVTVSGAEQLKELIASQSGYLIVDNMAKVRLNKEINHIIGRQELIFYNQLGSYDPIWVFAF